MTRERERERERNEERAKKKREKGKFITERDVLIKGHAVLNIFKLSLTHTYFKTVVRSLLKEKIKNFRVSLFFFWTSRGEEKEKTQKKINHKQKRVHKNIARRHRQTHNNTPAREREKREREGI